MFDDPRCTHKIAIYKQIRSHKLTGKLTVSAAVDWLANPAKPGEHDPLDLVRRLVDVGLDYTVDNDKRLIYIADTFALKSKIHELYLDGLANNRWLLTRGEGYPGGEYKLIPHKLEPFTGNGLRDALDYLMKYETPMGILQDVASEVLNTISAIKEVEYEEGELHIKLNRLRQLEDALEDIGLLTSGTNSLIILAPCLLAVAVPALRGVTQLMRQGFRFELTDRAKPVVPYLRAVT